MQQPVPEQQNITSHFSSFVTATADQYLADISLHTAIKGKKPEFDELMQKLKDMQEELTKKAVEIINLYKGQHGDQVDDMTNECKSIIETSIQGFIKKI